MEPPNWCADASALRAALVARRVAEPFPEWDPGSRAWLVRARSRYGGGEWVLGRGERPTAFAEQHAAWEAANWLRVAATPYVIGRW